MNARSIATVLLLAAFASAGPQGPDVVAQRRGLLPGTVKIGGGLTAAQRTTVIARLEEIKRILLQVPELAQPNGFELMAEYVGGNRHAVPDKGEDPRSVVEHELRLFFYVPTKASRPTGCSCITVRVNAAGFLGARPIRDESGREIYREAARGETVPSATQVYGELSPNYRSIVDVLFTSGRELPWKTVSREEYYKALIFDTEGKDGEKMANYRKSLEKTRYQEWMDGAAGRKKNREAALKTVATSQTAAQVAAMRKTMEDTESEVTESLKKSEAADLDRNTRAQAASHSLKDKILVKLESMTPAERSMPALIDPARVDSTGWLMADRDSLPIWRVFTPNHEFWRARISPVEARSITVHIGASLLGETPVVHNALWQTYKKVDWAAIKRLLDERP